MSLTPSSAERLVKLNDGQQLIATGLCEAQVSNEKLAVGIECFEQIRNAFFVSQIGKSRPILQGLNEQFALSANFSDLAVRDERIGNIAKGRLDRFLVIHNQV